MKSTDIDHAHKNGGLMCDISNNHIFYPKVCVEIEFRF